MKVGDTWYDIDGVKFKVVDVTEVEREDGSIIRNISSKRVD